MAINYTLTTITITDEIGNQPPIVLPSSASAEVVEAALLTYHPHSLPDPEWVAFGGAVQSSIAVNELLGTALQQMPALGLGLGVGLGRAADGDGDARMFLSSWAIANSLGLVSAALLDEILVLAEQCNLPPDFLAALQAHQATG